MEAQNSSAPIRTSKGQLVAIAVTGAAALIGIGLWVYQLQEGLEVTNMRNLNSWGLYITNFMFLVGLSAGGLIISSAPKVFGVKGFESISKVAIWTSICCTLLAVAFVVIDLGNPLRLWELLVYSNMTSPLMWDIIVISTYLVVSVIYLVVSVRADQGKVGHTAQRALSAVALVIAVSVHSVTAWVFSLQVSHEFWHTALMAPWFVCSALLSGLALVLVVCVILNKTGYLSVSPDLFAKLARLLATFALVDLYFLGCDLLTSAYGADDGRAIAAMMTTGPLAPFFWTEVLSGLACAVICMVPALRTKGMLAVAGILGILGIFCKRCQIILAGFGVTNLTLSGIEVGNSFPLSEMGQALAGLAPHLVYFPSLVEFAIVGGVICLGVCVFLLGLRFLPLRSQN